MSLLQKTDVYRGSEQTVRKSSDYGFVLALICMALAVVVGAMVFAPAPVGTGVVTSEITSVGP